ncbi:alpha/beta fold hydrolase [Ekhidna sp.]|uniref:YheT family hydrolase n=1 Tax=Ekhidna sp. TaxID=2608089 RepID=UPI003297020E
MPLIKSKYNRRPWYFFNGHFETIIPSLFYEVGGVNYERERLELPDGDFLDLDWVRGGNKRLIVLSHGLEGSADRHYIKRPAHYFSQKGWDILAWNNRSCSGEMNRLPRFYHHGATEDIAAVIDQGLAAKYEEVILIGFSMGAGMQQKYLGERIPDQRIIGAVSFSVPCNVQNSAEMLKIGANRIYENRFISKLKQKVLEKSEHVEMPVDLEVIKKVRSFKELDEAFTLKVHPEYKNANDFYTRITSDQFLPNIKIPLLIVNAINDPMLGDPCYPIELAQKSKNIYLEMPKKGGHVGFTIPGSSWSYMEFAADGFIDEVILSQQTSRLPH